MEKKKRDTMLPKRFNAEDIKNWQEQANLTTDKQNKKIIF